MLLAAILLGSSFVLVESAGATMDQTGPVEITFETTSPYYQPRVAVVSVGTPIRWINSTASPHTVRHDGCVTDQPCAFQSIAVFPDSDFVLTPLPPGRYAYHCELHPIMRGMLVVLDSRSPTQPQPSVDQRGTR
jgi:plastocyanin